MTIKNLIELGKMGYTKKEIGELMKADTSSDKQELTGGNEKLLSDIADLKTTVASLQATLTKTTPPTNNPQAGDGQESIDDILLKLAGGEQSEDDTK